MGDKAIITLSVPSEYIDIVDRTAAELEVSRSEMIRTIISCFLEKEPISEPGYGRIFTTNLYKWQIKKIIPLVGSQKRYFSRSELVRIAIRDYCLDRMYILEEQKEIDVQELVREAQHKYALNNLEEGDEFLYDGDAIRHYHGLPPIKGKKLEEGK